jgi:hypothetical protein
MVANLSFADGHFTARQVMKVLRLAASMQKPDLLFKIPCVKSCTKKHLMRQ